MRFPPQKQAVKQHHRNAYADGAVGDIEGWPMPCSDMKIEEVNNSAETNPVDDIADRTADDQSDRNGEHGAFDTAQPINKDGHDHCGDEREQQRVKSAALVEQAEAHSAIVDQDDVEKRSDLLLLTGQMPCEEAKDAGLAELIEHDDRNGRSEAAHQH